LLEAAKGGVAIMTVKIMIMLALSILVLTASNTYADHERFIVGTMRNVDPSASIVTSTSGTCVPSHDRERLQCYFTTFGLWKAKTEAQVKKDFEEIVQAMNKDSAKQISEMKKSFCDDKKMMEPDPIRLKYNVGYKAFPASIKAFCERPTRDSALSAFQTMYENEGRKCLCVVSDWRSTFARQIDRWVENTGPTGPCGVIKVFTLVPHDLNKMKDPVGPLLWRLDERTVVTRADNEGCKFFNVKDDAVKVSWDAPYKSIDCGEVEFTSALEGMSDPPGPKGK